MKKLKRITAVAMLLMMMVSVLAGCSVDELRYWDQSVRLYKLGIETDMVTTGEMKFNFDSKQLIPAGTDEAELKSMMPLINLIEKGAIRYEISQSIARDQQDIKILGKADPAAAFVPYFEMVRVNKVNYIKIAPIRSFVETYLSSEEKVMKAMADIPKDIAYIEISDASLLSELNQDSSVTNTFGINYTQQMLTMSQGEQAKMVEPFIQVIDEVLRKGYEGYSMDIIQQDGNKFVMTMKFNEMGSLLSRLLNYSLDHSDQIQKSLFDGLRKVPASALATMVAAEKLTDADKNKAIDEMQVMAKEMLKDTSGMKAEVNEALKDVDKEIQKVMGNSKLTMEMEILDTNNIRQTMDMQLDIKDPVTEQVIKMGAVGTFFTKYNAALNIQKPEGKGITLEALEAMMPKDYTIYLDDYYMSVNSGLGSDVQDLDILMLKNTAYLYADDLEKFTEGSVVLHEAKGYAVVKQGDSSVEIPLLKKDGDYFFKVKDLSKLGFKVEWLSDFNAIRLTK